MTHLQEGQDLLTQIIIKVGKLGVGHVVDKNNSGALRDGILQCCVQLINDTLQSGLMCTLRWDMFVCCENSNGGVTDISFRLKFKNTN